GRGAGGARRPRGGDLDAGRRSLPGAADRALERPADQAFLAPSFVLGCFGFFGFFAFLSISSSSTAADRRPIQGEAWALGVCPVRRSRSTFPFGRLPDKRSGRSCVGCDDPRMVEYGNGVAHGTGAAGGGGGGGGGDAGVAF